MRFQFSNVVVVDTDQIGVIVKSWENKTHDVYVRSYNCIKEYKEKDIQHYVYSKELHYGDDAFYEASK